MLNVSDMFNAKIMVRYFLLDNFSL